jgi:[protein-PII] uridylyltransferase
MREASAIGASAAQLGFIEHAPLRYLASRGHADVLRDARLAAGLRAPSGGDGFALGIRTGAAPGTWVVDVVARDRAGLVVTIAGVLALCGLDVLAAEIHTHRGAIAVDSFTVASATLAAVEHATWASVERLLGAALAGRLDLETRLAERRRHYERTPAREPVAVTVTPTGAFGTRIEVRAPDRVGLLHDLARTLASADVGIRRAVVTTTGGVALDIFEVMDAAGEPLDAETRERLAPLLTATASGPPSA